MLRTTCSATGWFDRQVSSFSKWSSAFNRYLDCVSTACQNLTQNLSGLLVMHCVKGHLDLHGKSCLSTNIFGPDFVTCNTDINKFIQNFRYHCKLVCPYSNRSCWYNIRSKIYHYFSDSISWHCILKNAGPHVFDQSWLIDCPLARSLFSNYNSNSGIYFFKRNCPRVVLSL